MKNTRKWREIGEALSSDQWGYERHFLPWHRQHVGVVNLDGQGWVSTSMSLSRGQKER